MTDRHAAFVGDILLRQILRRSTNDAAGGLVTGNPVLPAVLERGTAPLDVVIQTVAKALSAEGGAEPFHLPMRAMVIVARAV